MGRDMEMRQEAYSRRATQNDDLAESRSRHELFRSSMFSTGAREHRPAGPRAFQRGPPAGGSGGDGGSSGDTSENTTAARIDAAIKAAMAVDSRRGVNTFPYMTPPGSIGASGSFGGGGGAGAGGGGGGGPAAAGGYGMAMQAGPVDYAGSRDSGESRGSRVAYRTYHPAAANAPIYGGNGSSSYATATGYRSRSVAPVDESVTSNGSMGPRSGSGASLGGSGGGSGRGYAAYKGGGGADLAAGGAAAGDPPSYRNSGGGTRAGHIRGTGSGGGSGGSARAAAATAQKQAQQRRSTWESGGGTPTPRAMWQPQSPVYVPQKSSGSSDGFSSDESGKGAGLGTARGEAFQKQLQKSRRDFSEHINADSSGAIAPPQQWMGANLPVPGVRMDCIKGTTECLRPELPRRHLAPISPDMPPVETSGTGGSSLNHGGGAGHGGGEGVALTPAGYSEPLELPDGCHHISLAKFLEVMTGPGLRVRKHHRAGKGSSGLRVLRYSEEGDNLTWDSHKILGAAQHVLPMSDVESVSMHAGNRVVLLCVGGKDSYAVFEAANDDAAAVLYVGLERLRERTRSRRDPCEV